MNVNLIPRQRHDSRRGRARLKQWATLNAGIAFLLLAGLVYTHVLQRSATAVLRQDAQALRLTIERDQEIHQQLTEQLHEATRDLEANLEVGYQPDWSILLGLIGELSGEQVVLRQFDLRSELMMDAAGNARTRRTIELAGLGQTQDAVSRLPIRLQEIALFTNVTLHESRQERFLNNDAVTFRLAFDINTEPEVLP